MIHEKKVKVVDSIMGSGKTTAAFQHINSNPDMRVIFCSPYLDELERANQGTGGRLVQPVNRGDGKLAAFHELLTLGKDIAITHSLFLSATSETWELIHEGGYTLILDEVLDVLQSYNTAVPDKPIKPGDVSWLIEDKHIIVDETTLSVRWHGSSVPDFQYSEIKRMADANCLRCVDGDTLFWVFPIEALNAFDSIIVLTYLYESSVLHAYLEINHMGYEKFSIERKADGGYNLFADYDDAAEVRKALSEHIHIYDGDRNALGHVKTSFSKHWYEHLRRDGFHQICNAMRGVRNVNWHAGAERTMWTCPKDFREKFSVKGFSYIHQLRGNELKLGERELRKLECFVPMTLRASNDYSQRDCLLYLCNRFPNPKVKNFFNYFDYQIDEKQFATAEMIQWIWRSAIRNGQDINIYIPSSRMRTLLIDWLNPVCE